MTSYRRTGPNAANPRTHHYDSEIPTQPWRDDYPAQGDSGRIKRRRLEGSHISSGGPSSNSLDLFAHSHHHTFHNSTVNAVLGDQINNTESSGEVGLNLLCKEVARVGAFHDSEARFPQPRCHPETRKAVLADISSWVKGEVKTTRSRPFRDFRSPENEDMGIDGALVDPGDTYEEDSPVAQTPIHWLYGPAGVGKSAIAQTLAERFENSHLAASFFFSRSDPTRDNARYLAVIIAFCLASIDSKLRAAIDEVVRKRPIILSSSIEQQFKELIAEPLRKLPRQNLEALPKIVIIDGLDECQGSQNQRRVLSTILDNLVESVESDSDDQPHLVRRKIKRRVDEPFVPIPLRFIIASRSEPQIRDIFSDPRYVGITNCTELGENYQTSRDIETYLRDGFRKIVRKHDAVKNTSFSWPSEGVIDNLVQRASGQFIYATTILKYVGDEYSHPMEQLDRVLGLPVNDPEAFSDLDALYRQLMISATLNRARVLQILGVYFCLSGGYFELSTWYTGIGTRNIGPPNSIYLMEKLLFLPAGAVSAALRGLHSVLKIESDSFKFRHKSFTDFLLDERRAGDFFLDLPVYHEYLTRSCISIINATTPDLTLTREILYVLLNFTRHIKLARSMDVLVRELNLCQLFRWEVWRYQHQNDGFRGYKILSSFFTYFNLSRSWSNCMLKNGLYITGIDETCLFLIPELEVLCAFILDIQDRVSLCSPQIDILSYLGYNSHFQELSQMMDHKVFVCHSDCNAHRHVLNSDRHFINVSRGHQSLAKSCFGKIRSDGGTKISLRYARPCSHLCQSPQELDLIEEFAHTIDFIIDKAQLQEAILWLQKFSEECDEAKNVIQQCRRRIEVIEESQCDKLPWASLLIYSES